MNLSSSLIEQHAGSRAVERPLTVTNGQDWGRRGRQLRVGCDHWSGEATDHRCLERELTGVNGS